MAEINVKVSIERANCISCGNCWSVCPKVFEQSKEDSKSEIVKEYRVKSNIAEGLVPKKLNCVKDAEANCPVKIIRVK